MQPQGIILSPGPKRPWDAESVYRLWNVAKEKFDSWRLSRTSGTWILLWRNGKKGERPMHGKVTEITNMGTGVLKDFRKKFKVTLSFADCKRTAFRRITISTLCPEDGAVMGLSHKNLPLYGFQFHPEAVLTEYGHELLENFCRIGMYTLTKNDIVQTVKKDKGNVRHNGQRKENDV